jgi:hypothetical protein
MDEVEELEPTRANPLRAAVAALTTEVAALDNVEAMDDATLTALRRQTARLRAIELQLAAVYDLRTHTESMRQAVAPGAATDCA